MQGCWKDAGVGRRLLWKPLQPCQSVKLHLPCKAGSLGSSFFFDCFLSSYVDSCAFPIFLFLSNCFLAVELENTQEVQSCSLFLKNQEDFSGLGTADLGGGSCHTGLSPPLPGRDRPDLPNGNQQKLTPGSIVFAVNRSQERRLSMRLAMNSLGITPFLPLPPPALRC